jgi:outer membrane protein OmpA-like peptidoglycan-associated protein
MKILLIGFLIFSAWAAFATHIFVCNIKGLCDEPMAVQTEAVSNKVVIIVDTLSKSSLQNQSVIPEKLFTYFAFDKSEFNSDAHSNKYFDDSKAYIDQNLKAKLSITGYTDAIGSDEYNVDLGFRRARSMQNYFEGKGFPADKIIVESKGEKEPADSNNTEAGRAHNRRAVITINN